jgi:hypothetical protein
MQLSIAITLAFKNLQCYTGPKSIEIGPGGFEKFSTFVIVAIICNEYFQFSVAGEVVTDAGKASDQGTGSLACGQYH